MNTRWVALTASGVTVALAALAVGVMPREQTFTGTPQAAFQRLSSELTQGLKNVKPCTGPEWVRKQPSKLERCVVVPGRRDGPLIQGQGADDTVTVNVKRLGLNASGWYRAGGKVNDIQYRLKGLEKQIMYVFYNPPLDDDNERLTFFVETEK